jgi:hypothetical protein
VGHFLPWPGRGGCALADASLYTGPDRCSQHAQLANVGGSTQSENCEVSPVKLPYWIQRADFTSTDFEPVDLVEVEAILRDHDWRGELQLLKSLQEESEDCCPPSIGINGADAILQLCPSADRTADCYLVMEASPHAIARGERVSTTTILVTDPEAVRYIRNGSLLLQYRLLQLHFRPDHDALLYLFDEFGSEHNDRLIY